MQRLSPTLGILESGRNCRNFVEDNMSVFWDVFKPLLPYLVGLYLFDLGLTVVFGTEISIGNLVVSYFMAALAITWHRVVLHGSDRYVPMNPLKPQKHELVYLGVGILINIVCSVIMVIPVVVGIFAGAAISGGVEGVMVGGAFFGLLLISPVLILLVLLSLRLSFYFPAKAVGSDMTLIEAFKLSKGYVCKLLIAYIVASWRLLLFALVVVYGASMILELLVLPIGGSSEMVNMVMQIPMLFYFSPLLTVLGITVLSNFYQYALQYHGQDHSGETHID